MKNIYLSFAFFLIAHTSFASGEEVWVVTNTGSDAYAKSATELGPVDPCITIPFYVDVHIPSGYVIVGKYEWFVNGVSVKITTTPNDPILQWQVKSNPTNVYCKVTYKNQEGTLSTPYTSTAFTPDVKSLNFGDITTSLLPLIMVVAIPSVIA